MAAQDNPLNDESLNIKINHTRNGPPERTRIEIAALQQLRMAGSIDLRMQAKQAH